MIRRVLFSLPVVLCLVAVRAGAEPIIKVEYWGTVMSVPNPRDEHNVALDEFSVGDPIHGTMHIDTALAPPARQYAYGNGSFTLYSWLPEECDAAECPPLIYGPSGFVTDDRAPAGVLGMSNDYVKVNDAALAGAADSFELANFETVELGAPAPNDIDQHDLRLFVTSTSDFIHGDGLAQQFDVHAPPGGIEGSLQDFLHGTLHRIVFFSVDRLRATPLNCPAT